MENQYKKSFDEWNNCKKNINYNFKRVAPRSGEVWICDFGINIGFEIDGKENFKRPALIIKSFGKNGAVIVPLTNSEIKTYGYNIGERGNVNLTQIKFIDSKRLHRKIDRIEGEIINKLKDKLFQILKD